MTRVVDATYALEYFEPRLLGGPGFWPYEDAEKISREDATRLYDEKIKAGCRVRVVKTTREVILEGGAE